MKNMGLSRLAIVDGQPQKGSRPPWKAPEARAMAWNSRDILENAEIHADLQEAVTHTGFLLGTSSRKGRRNPLSPEDGARVLLDKARHNDVAVLFGPEDRGLSNSELSLCHSHVTIPTGSSYQSLNLAQAVAIVCYELFLAAQEKGLGSRCREAMQREKERGAALASLAELKGFFAHLREVLMTIGFLDPRRRPEFMGDIADIFHRALLNTREVRILRGILRQIEWFGSERKA